jgi:uncharacterized protein (DUF305 family)
MPKRGRNWAGWPGACSWFSMRSTASLFTALMVVLLCAPTACAMRPFKHNGGRVHFIAAQDFAQVLLAHCESGIQLAQGVESVDVSAELKGLAAAIRADEEQDRPAIAAWIARQTKQPSIVSKLEIDEIRSEHSATVEQLRRSPPTEVNRYARRVMETHLREQLTFLRETPAEDKELQTIADEIWRRTSLQLEKLAQRSAVEDSAGTYDPPVR